jgi:starch synthase
MSALRIGFVTSELAPFVKAGGLADVSASLPAYLHRAGHDLRVFVPLYGSISRDDYAFTRVPELSGQRITLGDAVYPYEVLTAVLPGTDLAVYFVHCGALFNRNGTYTNDVDEHRRFFFLSRAALESMQRLGWAPDILHAHDWPTALLPVCVKTIYAWDKLFATTKSVLTIHNLGYQGVFGTDVLRDLGPIGTEYFDGEDLRAGRINFLKTGLRHADQLTTVSPTYAREIQTPEYGHGLDGLLRERAAHLVGILNGVDYDSWDPATDPYLPAHYTPKDLSGKAANKAALVHDLGMTPAPKAPVIGVVTRLAWQKGLDLFFDALPALLAQRDFRFALLGSGERKYEEFFMELQRRHPGRVCFWNGYNERLAHRIEAGADIFAMPSRYEPCGLNQMYSLKYGTVPVVRKTGGLADTVTMYDPKTGKGNGVVFEHLTAEGLHWGLDTAMSLYEQPEHWTRMQKNGMAADFSWDVEGAKYVGMYERLAKA